MNHTRLIRGATLSIFLLAAGFSHAATPAENDARLKQALRQYPEADTNRDGVLTEAEARAHLKTLRSGTAGATKGAKAKVAAPVVAPAPTRTDVAYGPYPRNVLDFWEAKSDLPAPVVVFIHGGGFVSGDKSKARTDRLVRECLEAGVSYAAINYRYRTDTPIQDVLRDCARAIQFIRSKAGEWNVDKTRIASHGGSAGAGTSLWLAFHDDLADSQSSDPVRRESSRIAAAGANACQFSYDIVAWDDLFKDVKGQYQDVDDRPSFYGLKTDEELLSPAGRRIRADCDMYGLISRDDPPVFLNSVMPGGTITSRGHLLHHPLHAKAIYDRCQESGVGVVAQIPGLNIKPGRDDPQSLRDFLFRHLKIPAATTRSVPAPATQ